MTKFFSDNENRKKKISETLKNYFKSEKGKEHKEKIKKAKIEYWKKIKGE